MDLLAHLDRQEPQPEESVPAIDQLRVERAELAVLQCQAERARNYGRAADMRLIGVHLLEWMKAKGL